MLLAGPALADTVWLDNGDRLSGEIVLMDGGKLALKTRYAGQVRSIGRISTPSVPTNPC